MLPDNTIPAKICCCKLVLKLMGNLAASG
jgi:hypothetical protein